MSALEEAAISHHVSVARLPQAGMPFTLKADEQELQRLAQVFELVEVSAFSAEMLVKKWRKDGVRITGTVRAAIVQSCVVTLEPINANVSNEIDTVFVPENSKLSRPPVSGEGEIILDYEGPDPPETFVGDMIDVGALAQEMFGLAIDPYPRKEGVDFKFEVEEDDIEEKKPSPFAKLIDFPKR
jgi:uncharacterized metal-binding protein YceD (DUF177 family)